MIIYIINLDLRWLSLFIVKIRRTLRSKPTDTLLPYTTLFRSLARWRSLLGGLQPVVQGWQEAQGWRHRRRGIHQSQPLVSRDALRRCRRQRHLLHAGWQLAA